ncbi:hypothetical protein QFC19_002954 [Naganishia cerealis]|uniref:Uncharacterized protein n=1 Tax=Naganishia cerealis TaxID=610337 RepID=A0ACC2W7I5_9TREE|nr:hypothetical protein QFC19_002954 [Naganishia cerealis]
MKPLPALPVNLAAQRLAPVRILFPHPSPLEEGRIKDIKWTLGWETPKEIIVCGGWPVLGSYRKGRKIAGTKEVELNAIDLAIVMPDEMFTPKDRTAYRYFHKRAHYIAVIASSLEALGRPSTKAKQDEMSKIWKSMTVDWDFEGGDMRRPILVLKFPKDKSLGIKHTQTIRLLTAIGPDVFPLASLYPSKSNIKLSSEDTAEPTATPLYNTSILKDTLHKPHLLWLHAMHKTCPSFRSALALWRVWGDRRGLSGRSSGGGVGWSWFGSMVLGFIVQGGEIGTGKDRSARKPKQGLGRGLSEWQLLRAGWEFLSSTDFSKTPVYMKPLADTYSVPAAEMISAFEHVFVEPTGKVNLLAGWEEGEISLLRSEARGTLDMLADSSVDRFDQVFLEPLQSGAFRFDETLRIDATEVELRDSSALGALEQPDLYRYYAESIARLLRRGLNTRVRNVVVQAPTPARWKIQETASTDQATLEISMWLDKEQAPRALDQGPPSEDSEGSAAFREMWGEKAELRRFKDGSITESVVWNVSRPEERALITGMATKWLLERHFGVSDVSWAAPAYLPLVQLPASAHQAINVEHSEKFGFKPAMDAFESIYKLLKAADDELPLTILNFTAMSEQLRYTSVFVPHAVDLERLKAAPECLQYIPAIDVLMQFESSRRWPDDLVAIQKVKMAFLVKLVGLLQEAGHRATVALEPNAPDIQDHAAVEVIAHGFAFRLRVYHDRERTLLERMIEDDDLPSEKLRVIAQQTYDLHVRRFTSSPRHHAAISTLHHLFPSFASASRLLKRWLSSHMLSSHLPSEFVELLMASVYISPESFEPPSSAHTGFARALQRLAKWNWRETPILVPLYSLTSGATDEVSKRPTFPEAAQARAIKAFKDTRKVDREYLKQTMIIATEEDLLGKAWLRDGQPSKLIASRVVMLAAAGVEMLSAGVAPIESLFKTPLREYDFLVHLKPEVDAQTAYKIFAHADSSIRQAWESHQRNQMSSGMTGKDILVDFNPVTLFVQDLEILITLRLQRMYGHQIVFFHDRLGGTIIGGLWNPAILQHRTFKPFLGYSTKPVVGDEIKVSSMVEANKEGILAEIKRLGEGMVNSIEVLQHE